ncbi:hypothetical protein FOZ63_022831, partial [Perkinsus olseni]
LFLRVRVDKSAVVRRHRPKLNSVGPHSKIEKKGGSRQESKEERPRMPNSSTATLEKKNINTRAPTAPTPTQGDKIVYHAFRVSLLRGHERPRLDGFGKCCVKPRTSAILDDLGETQSTQSDMEERNKPGIPLPE